MRTARVSPALSTIATLLLLGVVASARTSPAPVAPAHRPGAQAFAEAGTRVIHELVGENAGDQLGWVGRGLGDLDEDGGELASWSAVEAGETLGFDAVGLGDVDGDGGVDYLLSSAWSSLGGQRPGRA